MASFNAPKLQIFLMLITKFMYYATQMTFSLVVCVFVLCRDTSYIVCC